MGPGRTDGGQLSSKQNLLRFQGANEPHLLISPLFLLPSFHARRNQDFPSHAPRDYAEEEWRPRAVSSTVHGATVTREALGGHSGSNRAQLPLSPANC